MVESSLSGLILAAGHGKRMQSETAKVLHPVGGLPMIAHVVREVRRSGAHRIVCVIGYQEQSVRAALASEPDVDFALQPEPRGTGHAVACAAPALADFTGQLLICCGDTPLLTGETLAAVVSAHRANDAPATLLVAEVEDPRGYGRVLVEDGSVSAIVEEADADESTRAIRRVNTGVYCVEWPAVAPLLEALPADNAQGEQYLTDIMRMLAETGTPGAFAMAGSWEEVQGINDRIQLAQADGAIRDRVRKRLMRSGVTLSDPQSSRIDVDVEIGADSSIGPFVVLEGRTIIGSECTIGPYTRLVDVRVGDGARLEGWNRMRNVEVAAGEVVSAHEARWSD